MGAPLHRRLPEKVKATGLRRSAQWGDFGPIWAAEQLAERHGIAVSAATLRGWLLAKGEPHFQRRKRTHSHWAARTRKAQVGELVPREGAHPDGCTGRGSRCVLKTDIDNASSRVWARFSAYVRDAPGHGPRPARREAAGETRAI